MLRYEQKSKRHCHRPARGLINSRVVREVLVDDGMRALGHSVGDLQGGRSPGFKVSSLMAPLGRGTGNIVIPFNLSQQ